MGFGMVIEEVETITITTLIEKQSHRLDNGCEHVKKSSNQLLKQTNLICSFF